jgi:hypothetical protein
MVPDANRGRVVWTSGGEHMRMGPIRRDLQRVDVSGGDTAGLPWSLLDAVEAAGGLWFAGDWYTDPADIVAQARAAGAVALRLDCRDLTFLDELPHVRYLHLRTDGRPPLEPVAALRGLQALILEVGALRGTLDLAAFPALRWLRIKLGGKGGAAMLPTMAAGHPGLAWLAVSETKAKVVADIARPFPSLRSMSIHLADHIRSIGDLSDAAPGLARLDVDVVGLKSLVGIDGAPALESLSLSSSPINNAGPLRDLRELRHLRLYAPRLESIEPLRGLPSLRFLELLLAGEPDRDVLDSLPSLAAIGRGKGFEAIVPWPDVYKLDRTDPLRIEWARLRSG